MTLDRVALRLPHACRDCGETHPKRGFYPVFEDENERLVKICWPCFDRRCDEELTKERERKAV